MNDEKRGEDRLQNVSDTALWVATYRADESERTDALKRGEARPTPRVSLNPAAALRPGGDGP